VSRVRRRSLVVSLVAAVVSTSACAALVPSVPVGQPVSTGGVQIPGATGSAQGSSPSAAATTPTQLPAIKVSPAAKAIKAQLGVQVYWHTMGAPSDVRTAADKVLNYIVGLGANSVGLTFPIFTDGVHPTRVYTVSDSTPDPATLNIVIAEAQARGLRVTLRPLIDETNIKDSKGDWRGTIQPVNMTTWFSSYWSVLQPYVQLAQQTGVNSFVMGTELNSLVYQKSHWQTIDAAAAQIYSGERDYADNWDIWMSGGSYSPAPSIGVDAYPDLNLADDASVTQLTNAWTQWLHDRSTTTLTKTVMQEVGIAAASGAYHHPALWATTGETVVPSIQINWFAAACASARSLHMAGIYFWDVDSYADPANPNLSDAGSIIGHGDQSIKSCFSAAWSG
jgi:glycosyl hydrolase family 113